MSCKVKNKQFPREENHDISLLFPNFDSKEIPLTVFEEYLQTVTCVF